jgi:phosphoribosylglycinamide formyltransferase 1
MNYGFYVSGKAGRLRKLIDWHLKVLNQTVVVITDSQEAMHLEEKLRDLSISIFFFDYEKEKFSTKAVNQNLSNFILDVFQKFKVDYCFCFGNHILRGELIKTYNKRIINFHPSVLPMFPGRLSIDQALNSSAVILGNTAHFIDEGIDTGKIIAQIVLEKKHFSKIGYEGIMDFQILLLMEIYAHFEQTVFNYEEIKDKLPDVPFLKTFLMNEKL